MGQEEEGHFRMSLASGICLEIASHCTIFRKGLWVKRKVNFREGCVKLLNGKYFHNAS